MKEEKELLVDELQERVNSSPFLILTDYTGLDVPGFSELRKRLRGAGAECHVYKNSFLKRAAAAAGLPEDIADSLKGQTAAVTGEGDVCATAKIIKTFRDEFQRPEIRAGVLDGKLLDAAQVNGLAALPAREVLLATLLGVLQAPATQLARVLNEPGASLARVLNAKAQEGGE